MKSQYNNYENKISKMQKYFATTGVRTQEDFCPLDLKSNALTTRP